MKMVKELISKQLILNEFQQLKTRNEKYVDNYQEKLGYLVRAIEKEIHKSIQKELSKREAERS